MSKTWDVLILGAGVAGLSCADEILKKSPRTKLLVLEKNNFVGGLAVTIRKKGFNYDLSPHRWYSENEELNQWINNLIGPDLITVKKNTPMYQFGKFFEYPIRISDVLKKINPFMSAYMLFSYILVKTSSLVFKKKIRTMKDAYISRFGLGLYQWFNRDYNDKLWGKNGCENMSPDFVSERVKNLSLRTALFHALNFDKTKIASLITEFKYPRMGIGQVSEKLAQNIINNGGQINLNEPVLKIVKQKNTYLVSTSSGEYSAKHIISSIPIDKFMSNFTDQWIDKLKYIHQKIVVIFANGKKLTDFTWVYVHPKKIKTFRFMETNNWSPAMSPHKKTSLVFEYPYQPGDEIEKISDQELINITIHDFLKYFAPKNTSRKDILSGEVYLVPNAYPKYDLNYSQALKHLYDYADKNLKNVQLIGRNGMFRYNNLDHSVYTGLLAAKNYLAGKKIYDLKISFFSQSF